MKLVTERKRHHFVVRSRYQLKRQTKKWKNRKKNKRISLQIEYRKKRRQAQKPFVNTPAPSNFSLIENTNLVLKYFKEAEESLGKGENLTIDISKVKELTPPTIALLAASVNDPDFLQGSRIMGNAPEKEPLKKLFTESGFYNFVQNNGFNRAKEGNLLHRETHQKVEPRVARDACIIGLKHVFGNETPFEPLYNILIESMSNTNNHANLISKGKCNWLLYVHNDPDKHITSYSFFDLGIGIFKSAVIQNYLKNFLKGTPLFRNINLVNDLLEGKIQSRIEKDNEIRGKGIPQIVEHAQSKEFKSFYIITDDVKIDVKKGTAEQLKYSLNGTFLYWELQKG